MPINTNKVVTIHFTLKDDEGNFIESTENMGPFSYISGSNQILPKLEEAVSQMIIGTKKDVKVMAAEGYGEYNEAAVQQIDLKEFPEDLKLEEGMQMIANSPEGKRMPFVINKIGEKEVTVDFNHPLAGKNLEFNVELLDVRDATPEELSHGHVHGPDGAHH
jgi:FKBP-type peptidyl-prolyl cis-trans isomerase SlyD